MNNSISLYDMLRQTDNKLEVYKNYIAYKTAEMRLPNGVMLELSPICNFDCQMCYVKMTEQEVCDSGYGIMRFDDWKYYIDSFKELGTMGFTLTGGECMIHPDFIRIYNYIYDLGCSVNLITNCSCLTDEILKTFVERPPTGINITIYGASEETYERLCKNGAAYSKVMNNIDRLLEKKMRLGLQCTINQLNIDDFPKIEKFGSDRGLRVLGAGVLSKYGKCNEKKIENSQLDFFSLNKQDFLEHCEDKTEELYYKNYVFPTFKNNDIKSGLPCFATKNLCSISWRGTMKVCSTFEPFELDPRKDGGVKACWDRIVEWGNNYPPMVECHNCIFYKECPHCSARHYNDTHEFGKPSPRLCFKVQHPEEAAKLQAEYDRRQAEKAKSAENNNKTETTPD